MSLFEPDSIPEAPVVERPGSDLYPTEPEYATALFAASAERCLAWGHPDWRFDLWEPACGDGRLVRMAQHFGLRVAASDLYDHGFGETGVDFLKTTELRAPVVFTNPPYRKDIDRIDLPRKFVGHAMRLGAYECWLLCRLGWLESADRFRELLSFGLAHIWIVDTRKAMWPSGKPPPGKETSTAMYNYAWYGFRHGHVGAPPVELIQPRPDLLEDRLF